MSNEEFKAPDWVANQPIEEPQEGPTKNQRVFMTVVLVFVIPLFLFLGYFEFGRAQQGNWRAWVYTFEWPFFGGVAYYLWRRIMRGDIPHIPRPDLSKFEQECDGKSDL